MKIRIHETDFEGNPVECTGEFFSGKTALDIVEQMKMNPFTGSLEPVVFMRRVLDVNGLRSCRLSEDEPENAAVEFLQRLTAAGFARYELEEHEFDTGHPQPIGLRVEKK